MRVKPKIKDQGVKVMSYVSKIFTVTLLGLAFLLTGCDPSGLSGADQILKETKPGTIHNSSKLNEAVTEYEIVDLGTLGGFSSDAYGINEAGQVVGRSTVVSGETHAFVWNEAGGMRDLGTLGGIASFAYRNNNKGQVVGNSLTSSNETHAFKWDDGVDMRDLGTLAPGIGYTYVISYAEGINDHGQVVGHSRTGGSIQRQRAFIWDEDEGMRDLGSLGGAGRSVARSINNSGQVVGNSTTDTGDLYDQRAFIWDEEDGMHDLGTLGGDVSYAFDINEAGQVVGNSITSSGERRAFIWDKDGGMRDLGTIGDGASYATDINDLGQVVGYIYTSNMSIAFIWDEIGGMRELPGLLGLARGINNSGLIVGHTLQQSGRRAVIWNPIQNSDTTPPEITFETNKTSLWPPNHKMRLVLSGISATDNIDENPTLTVSVESNERLNGLGDGNTDEDWQIIQAADDSYDLYVRAERNGNGSGRTYTVTITAEDASGNVAEEQVEVQVVRDRGKILN